MKVSKPLIVTKKSALGPPYVKMGDGTAHPLLCFEDQPVCQLKQACNLIGAYFLDINGLSAFGSGALSKTNAQPAS